MAVSMRAASAVHDPAGARVGPGVGPGVVPVVLGVIPCVLVLVVVVLVGGSIEVVYINQ